MEKILRQGQANAVKELKKVLLEIKIQKKHKSFK
jgi:hypothetical protein